MLEVRHLDAWYDRSHVVQDISFEVHAGEIVTLPAHQHINKEQIDYTIAAIREFYA